MPAWDGLKAALKADPAGVAEVMALADDLGVDKGELAWAIEIESHWRPGAINPKSRASGLIQIRASTLPEYGWTDGPAAFARLSRSAQVPYLRAYWRQHPPRPGQVYLSLAAPSFVGRPGASVVYPKGSDAWDQNPGWRPRSGGAITVDSIQAYARMPDAAGRPTSTGRAPEGWWFLALLLLLAESRER